MQAVQWKDGILVLLDQRLLPAESIDVPCRTAEETADAIANMAVRGAPAIGVAAAFGVVLAARQCAREGLGMPAFREKCDRIRSASPTAVNLMWAVDRMLTLCTPGDEKPDERLALRLEREALRIQSEDIAACRAIGRHGNALIGQNDGILTHCNAGALATAGYGTALGIIRAAHEAGKNIHVYADETRPYLQGARLTATELHEEGIPVTLLCDNMAGWLTKTGKVQKIIVGADRIAANGDTANKIGTYSLGILAQAHGIALFIAAPLSTVDFSLPDGTGIPIEMRPPEEVFHTMGVRTAPQGIEAYNPAFDVLPAAYINAIITDRGVAKPPFSASLAALRDKA